jgi:cytochrome oxidase Cu insertion factor (SCO1/SenC/PrrC family)
MRVNATAAWACVLLASAFAACTNGGGLGSIGGGGGGTPSPLPSGSGIGLAIPTGKIGVVNDPVWGTLSGYTQDKTSQVLAFPPGSKLTITNLSKVDPHTLNVIAVTKGPPPAWPHSPSLGFYPSGNGVLGDGYASGTLNPGASVTVKLSKPGIYLIGCAFHYVEFSMRDVIEVVAGATPGPTASPGPGGYAVRRGPIAKRNDAKPSDSKKNDAKQPQLVDQRGKSFTLDALRGKPLAVTFVSAHCTDACPLINAQFADAARRLARARAGARLVTITLDPEHDSPATMRALAERFDADPRYWLVAGGSTPNVRAVMHAFGVVSIEGKHGYHDEHTTFVYVLDSSGRLAQTILASSALSDAVVDALRGQRVAER